MLGPYLAAGAHAVPASADHGALDGGAPVGCGGADLVAHDGQVGLLQHARQLPVSCKAVNEHLLSHKTPPNFCTTASSRGEPHTWSITPRSAPWDLN